MWHDKIMGKVLNEAYEEFKDELIDSSQVRVLFYSYFKYISSVVSSGYFPTIKIPKFGTLYPSVNYLQRKLNIFKNKEEEYFEQSSVKIENAINRLKTEKIKRKRNASTNE